MNTDTIDDDEELREFQRLAGVPEAEIAPAKYVKLVERWNGFAMKAAESVIGLAHTLADAKSSLSDGEFNQFCEEINLDQNGSTFRKLKKIGEEYARFVPFLKTLPNAWTTVYALACIEKDEFDRISPKFSPFMTAKEMFELLYGKGENNSITRDLVIDLAKLDPDSKRVACRELHDLRKKYGFQMQPSSQLVRLLKPKDKKARLTEADFITAIGAAS